MASILLIQPPIFREEYSARGSEHTLSILPPMGLAYIAAYVRQHGHEVEIYDGMSTPLPVEDVVRMAERHDVVGITTVSTFALRAIEIIRGLKKAYPSKPVIAGGPHANALPETCLVNGADLVVLGEGERPVLSILNAIDSGGDLYGIKGTCRLKNGRTVKNPSEPRIERLDDIPMPARDLLPMHLYRSSEARTSRQPSHSMFASRGCNGTCTFCNKRLFGSITRYFSKDRIAEEFFLLKEKYGAMDVALWDDNFVANKDVAHGVCDELIGNGFNRSWSIEARIDAIETDILKHLKEAGCDFIAYGIESGSQEVLDRMNKRVTLEQIRNVVRLTKQAGIKTRGYFMIGLPHETMRDIEKTIDFAMELDVDVASFTVFVPLPGTLEYNRALKSGVFRDPEYYLHGVYPEFNFPDEPLYVPAGMTAEELIKAHRKAYNRYYFRPGFIVKNILTIHTYDDVCRYWRGFRNLLVNFLYRK